MADIPDELIKLERYAEQARAELAGLEGEEYASVHQTGCKVDSGEVLWIDAHEAWVALSDGVPGCAFCRPELELGFDAD